MSGRVWQAIPGIVDVNLADQGELNVTGADGNSTQVASTGLDGADGPMWLAALDGRAPAGPAEIAIASRTMTQLGLHVGDTTTVGGACGEREMTVVGRVIVPVMFGGDPDHGSIITRGAFHELCAAELIAEVDRTYGALVRFADPTTADAVLDDLFPEGYFTEPGLVPSSVTALEEIGQVPRLIAGLVAVLGIAAAGNALLLAVRRRGGEIAVLRALGLRPSDARRVLGWQAATMATVAALVGIPVGILLGRMVWTGIARPANVVIRVDVVPIQLVAISIFLLAVLLALAIWPGRRASLVPRGRLEERMMVNGGALLWSVPICGIAGGASCSSLCSPGSVSASCSPRSAAPGGRTRRSTGRSMSAASPTPSSS